MSAIQAFVSTFASTNVAFNVLDNVSHDLFAVIELVHALIFDSRVDQVDNVETTANVERAPNDAWYVAEYSLE